jgi:hypothetical protein
MSIESLMDYISKLLNINVSSAPTIPTPLILTGVANRSGLSPIKIASRIIARKSEAGLSVGVLSTGEVAPDEIMERIRVEEIIRALQEEAIILVAIPPGILVQAAGTSPSGPVTVLGSTTNLSGGKGIIL